MRAAALLAPVIGAVAALIPAIALAGGDGTPITSSTSWPDVAWHLGTLALWLTVAGWALWAFARPLLDWWLECHKCSDEDKVASG